MFNPHFQSTRMHNQPLSTIITLLFLLSSSLFLSSSSSSLRTSVINTDESGPNNDDNDDNDLNDLKTTPILEDSIVDTSIDNSPTGVAEVPLKLQEYGARDLCQQAYKDKIGFGRNWVRSLRKLKVQSYLSSKLK